PLRRALDPLGVPGDHDHFAAADVVGVARVCRGRDALRPPDPVSLVAVVPGEGVVAGRCRARDDGGGAVEVVEHGVDPRSPSMFGGEPLDPTAAVGTGQEPDPVTAHAESRPTAYAGIQVPQPHGRTRLSDLGAGAAV